LAIGFDSIRLAPIQPNTSCFTNGLALARADPKISPTNMSLMEVSFMMVFSVFKAVLRTLGLESPRALRTQGNRFGIFPLV